jgi:hypothetical protein
MSTTPTNRIYGTLEGPLCRTTDLAALVDGETHRFFYVLPVSNYDDCVLHVQWGDLGHDVHLDFWVEQQIVREGPWVSLNVLRVVDEERSTGYRDTRGLSTPMKRAADFALVIDTSRTNALRVTVERVAGYDHRDLPGRLDIWYKLTAYRERGVHSYVEVTSPAERTKPTRMKRKTGT